MTLTTILEATTAFFNLLRRFERGDERATQKLKAILPERTYTRMVREREKQLDRAKFG